VAETSEAIPELAARTGFRLWRTDQ